MENITYIFTLSTSLLEEFILSCSFLMDVQQRNGGNRLVFPSLLHYMFNILYM